MIIFAMHIGANWGYLVSGLLGFCIQACREHDADLTTAHASTQHQIVANRFPPAALKK